MLRAVQPQVEIAGDARPVTFRRSQPERLSQRLWDLDWAPHTPWRFGDVEVESAPFDDALPFMRAHYAAIFEATSREARFLTDPMTAAKERFCREMDAFLFKQAGTTVGVLMAHPSDWSTYYMRSAAFLPEFRGQGLLSRCVEATFEPLRAAGCERVEVECSAANGVVVHMLSGLGFAVTAMQSSERHGSMIRFTKFLREDAEATFVRQFCAMSLQRPSRPKQS